MNKVDKLVCDYVVKHGQVIKSIDYYGPCYDNDLTDQMRAGLLSLRYESVSEETGRYFAGTFADYDEQVQHIVLQATNQRNGSKLAIYLDVGEDHSHTWRNILEECVNSMEEDDDE